MIVIRERRETMKESEKRERDQIKRGEADISVRKNLPRLQSDHIPPGAVVPCRSQERQSLLWRLHLYGPSVVEFIQTASTSGATRLPPEDLNLFQSLKRRRI